MDREKPILKIAIVGNIGKTSTSEILFSYFKEQGKTVVVSNSSGIFASDNSIEVKLPFGTMPNKYYNDIINRADVDVLITELCEESAYSDFYLINAETFDAIINCSYNAEIMAKHTPDCDDFGIKYLRELRSTNNHVLISEDDYDKMPQDFDERVILYQQLQVSNSSFNGMTLTDKAGNTYTTSFITSYQARNISAAMAALRYLREFDSTVFETTINDMYIRGRFDKFQVGDKRIILDTGWNGIDLTLDELSNSNVINLTDICVVFVPYEHTETEIEQQWRINVANYLKDNNIPLIVTGKWDNLLEDFRYYYIEPTGYNNYIYIPKYVDAINAALETDKTTLYVATSDAFRPIKAIFENKKDLN